MASDVTKSCKKCVVRRIINPAVYWMVEYERRKYYKKVVKQLENLLAKDVEKYTGSEELSVGKIVAIKDESGFHRGIITDIFNRNAKIIYSILLVDHGNIVEINKRKIYFIKNKELKNSTSSGFQVSIHNIQPATLDLDYEKNFLRGVFQKRKCNNWSFTAFKFVKDLFEKNPYVLVKSVKSSKGQISGEIYFLQESDGKHMSLSQKLCDEGFAIFSDPPKSMIRDSLQGDGTIGIEEKIPNNALFRELQNPDLLKILGVNDHETKSESSSNSVNHIVWPQQLEHNACFSPNKTSYHLSKKNFFKSENLNSSYNASTSSSTNSYSSSWVLKKCQPNTLTPSSSCDSFKKQDNCEVDQFEKNIPENSKPNLFRLVQKSMELFNKQKQN